MNLDKHMHNYGDSDILVKCVYTLDGWRGLLVNCFMYDTSIGKLICTYILGGPSGYNSISHCVNIKYFVHKLELACIFTLSYTVHVHTCVYYK